MVWSFRFCDYFQRCLRSPDTSENPKELVFKGYSSLLDPRHSPQCLLLERLMAASAEACY